MREHEIEYKLIATHMMTMKFGSTSGALFANLSARNPYCEVHIKIFLDDNFQEETAKAISTSEKLLTEWANQQ